MVEANETAPRLCSAIETLGEPDDKRIVEMQPTVWLLPFLLTIQIVAFNYPDAKVKDSDKGRRYKEQYAKWLVHTGLVIPSEKHRRCFRGALEAVLGVSSPSGDYIEAMSSSLIERGHMESRCAFSRLCHTLACRVNLKATVRAGSLFRQNADDYDLVRNICESCRARCLNDVEKEANAKEGKENGCDHEKGGRSRLKTVVRFRPEEPRCGSECFRYIEPRPRYDCYDSPDGMQTPVWGPILWSFIHVVSFAVKGSGRELSNHLCWLVETSRVLPCRYCRDNFFTNLRHALWRMGGYEGVADAILSWQIVQHVEKKGATPRVVPEAEELERIFCLTNGEVQKHHIEKAKGILLARTEGTHPHVTLDWYRLLYEALKARNKSKREGGEDDDDAFARLCFEIHTTVNQMLKKENGPPLTFEEVKARYTQFQEGKGRQAWHIELCLETR